MDTQPKRGRGRPRRYTLDEAEKILGRACAHEPYKPGYCLWCANSAAQVAARERYLARFESDLTSPG